MHRELLFFVCFSMPFNFVLLCINLVLFKVLYWKHCSAHWLCCVCSVSEDHLSSLIERRQSWPALRKLGAAEPLNRW